MAASLSQPREIVPQPPAFSMPRAAALTLTAMTLLLLIGGMWLAWLNSGTKGLPEPYGYRWVAPIPVLAAGSVGLMLALRVSFNRVGPLFQLIALMGAIDLFLDGYSGYALFTSQGAVPFGLAAAWTYNWTWLPFVGLSMIYFPLLFPTGHLPSHRWRPLAVAGIPIIILAIAGIALAPGPLEEVPSVVNPMGIEGLPEGVMWIAVFALMGSGVLAAASQFLRYRHAAEDERHQIKWVAAAAIVAGVAFCFAGLAEGPLQPYSQEISTSFILSIALLPIATGAAVLRYRLYDIDLLVNRTFVYVPLTALLAGVYIAATGLLRALFERTTGVASDASIALSTLLVVALLTPVKNELQTIVDRRFKEAPDPAKELNRLREQARTYIEVADLDRFLTRYLEEIVLTFNADGGAFHLEAASRSRDLTVGDWPSSDAFITDLVRDGLRYGSLALGSRNDGRGYTKAEQDAIVGYAELAAQRVAVAEKARVAAEVLA